MAKKNNLYLDLILAQAPRILSQINRDPLSLSYGCADRNHWHYMIVDTPSARFQEVCLTLSLLYKIKHKNNPYYKQKKIKNWINATISYWQSMQCSSGSFNEWYPNENSFVATAFSLYAVTESCLLLGLKNENLLKNITKAGDWLLSKNELEVCNQQTGAVLALENVFLLTKRKKYHRGAYAKFLQLKKQQTTEGWFREYGGADVGYSSVALDYLVKYFKKTKRKDVLNSTIQLAEYLSLFVHPNNTWGGEYGSRNTEYLIPDGVEYLSKHSSKAALLASSVRKNIKDYPFNLDDRYLCNNGYTFLQAHQTANKLKGKTRKRVYKQKLGVTHLRQAGIYVRSTKSYLAICNYKKGGAIKIYDEAHKKLIFENAGLCAELSNNKVITTQWLQDTPEFSLKNNKLTISGYFNYVKQIQTSPYLHIASRIFQLITGKFGVDTTFIKSLLRKLLITGKKTAPVYYKQSFNFMDNKVAIKTEISIKGDIKVKKLYKQVKNALIYVPSTRYFSLQELEGETVVLSRRGLGRLNRERKISFRKIIRVGK